MTQHENDPAFIYFPTDYRWSMGLLLCLNGMPWGGAELDEVHRVGTSLRQHVGDDEMWFRQWSAMGNKLEEKGRAELDRGHDLTAASYLFRSSQYYMTGERFLHPKSELGLANYRKAVDAFRTASELVHRPRIEFVEIPYENTSLPAVFVHGDTEVTGTKPAPAMVFFDGFDITKEIQYFKGIPDLAARGISCLIVDGPGNGEAIRFRNLPLIGNTEIYATPAVEYLLSRDDVDGNRIGVMAISLGGYFAPRAASLEKRFACCIAWGAQWDYYQTWHRRFEQLDSGVLPSLSVPPEHLMWILGVETRDQALDALKVFRLDGVVQQMACPFLLVHGEGDKQIPLEVAHKCFDAVGSERKTLKIFTKQEGGYHHCQIDNITIGVQFMWDWLSEILKPGT